MAGFGGCDRQLNRFEIAHFADIDHIRVFAQGCPQGRGEGGRIPFDFALVDDGGAGVVELKFNRVFDGENMALLGGGDIVDKAGQTGGFARAGGTGAEDQALVAMGQVDEALGQAQLFPLG